MHNGTYGFQIPDTGDIGQVWFPAMSANMTKLDAHNHNGVNSSLITPAGISKYTSSLLAASWVSDGGGTFHQNVTVPAGILEINQYFAKFIINSGADAGAEAALSWIRLTATTYRVYINDSALAVLVYYV